jgi:hypothetical protein
MSSLVEHIPSYESNNPHLVDYGNVRLLLLHKCSPFELILSQFNNFRILTTYFFKNQWSVISWHASKSPKWPTASLRPPVLLHIPSSLIYGLKNICGSLQCRKLHIIRFILLCDLHLFPLHLLYILLLSRAYSLLRERLYGVSYVDRT